MTSTLRSGDRRTGPGDPSGRGSDRLWLRLEGLFVGLLALGAVVWLVSGIGNVLDTYGSLAGGWGALFALLALLPLSLVAVAIVLWRRAAR